MVRVRFTTLQIHGRLMRPLRSASNVRVVPWENNEPKSLVARREVRSREKITAHFIQTVFDFDFVKKKNIHIYIKRF